MASQLRVDKIVPVDGVPTSGGGGIIQVVSATKTTSQAITSLSGNNWSDVSDCSPVITPKFNTSKILIMYNLGGGLADMNGHNFWYRIHRSISGGSSGAVAVSTDSSNSVYTTGGFNFYDVGTDLDTMFVNSMSGTFLDSPATTSACTYKFQVTSQDSSSTIYINRRGANSSNTGTSTMTLMEVSV